MIPRPLTAIRSLLWKLLHPGRHEQVPPRTWQGAEFIDAIDAMHAASPDLFADLETHEERAAFVEHRIIVHPCHDPACSVCFDVKPDNVTFSRAELVTLLSQAMNAGALLTAVDQMEDERAIQLALSGDCLSWAHVAEKLLDASLARRAR